MFRATDWIRAIGVPVVAYALLFLLVQFALGQWTQNEGILRPELITRITQQAGAPQESASEYIDSGETQSAGNPVRAQIETNQRNVFDALNGWALRLCGAGLGLSLLWSIYAMWRQRKVFGPGSQRAAWPAWALAALGYMAAAAALFFLFLDKLGIAAVIIVPAYIGAVVLIAGLGFVILWLSTALAASPVMKPSVPLGTRLTR